MIPTTVFVAGGSGYIGRCLIPSLLERNLKVKALVRPGSEGKIPAGCLKVSGNALDRNTYQDSIQPSDTFIHLVGVSHPSPSKRNEFQRVDYRSAIEAIEAAKFSGVGHFIYVSVAHPAPIMREYIEVRVSVEEYLQNSGLRATILRPWYVTGPGHRWPLLMLPFYKLAEKIPATRERALRLGLVTLQQMTNAILYAVETPPGDRLEIMAVADIRGSHPRS